jgi:hypothetical protein
MNRAFGIIVLLALALLLGACGEPAASGNEADASKVSGNIGAAHAGSIVRLTFFDPAAEAGAGVPLSVEAEVTQSGNFSLDLPDPVAEKFLSPLPDNADAGFCESGLNARMTGTEAFELVRAGETDAFAHVWFGSEPVETGNSFSASGIAFMYSDRALKVEATCTDTGHRTITESVDATLKAGWNRLVFTAEESIAEDGHETSSLIIRTVGKEPAEFSWQVAEHSEY